MSPQFSANDIEKLIRRSDLDKLVKLAEKEECEHDEIEDRCCVACGEMIDMRYEWEHDSRDMER